MTEAMFIYETGTNGIPNLQRVNGTSPGWSEKEVLALEQKLRSSYEDLVRARETTIQFKAQTLHVKVLEGDTSRQPTLELYPAPPSERIIQRLPVAPRPTAPAIPIAHGDWYAGFLGELTRLFASAEFAALSPVEKAMLQLVREELESFAKKTQARDLALLLLISVLTTAEHQSRTQKPNEPQPYAFALSGLERLLNETTLSPTTPWGRLPAKPNPEPAPSWLGRFWGMLKGS